MEPRRDPVNPTDDAARALARDLLAGARFAALGVIDPDSGFPAVSRVALALDPEGVPVTMISDLAAHARALAADPRAGLLVGEPGPKGDPLTHARMSVFVRAEPVARDGADRAALRELWLARHPKAKLYIDFGDFRFVRLRPTGAALNGGFGKAYRLGPDDLRPAAP
jgi:putative heme iron utilization protein